MSNTPDYQKHLTVVANVYDVAKLADRVARQHYVSTNVELVQHVINTANAGGGGTIARLDQDGLQRAYFELRLLEAGAKITYERVKHQGVALSTPPSLYLPTLEELEELVECVNVFETSGAIKKLIDDVREKTGIHGARLGDLGNIGFDLVYSELIRVLVNVGEKL